MSKPLYRYRAEVKKVVDGDTIICLVDLGFKTFSQRIVRLAGINAPEINAKDDGERARAISAKKYLTGLLSLDRLSIEFLTIYLESKALG
jgi:endonuclease YncB( thermonuclease family)